MYPKSTPTPRARPLAALLALILLGPLLGMLAAAPTSAQAGRPNVVLILADDMRADDLPWMPETNRLLVERGTSFAAMIATNSVCCPSRSTLLTGRYPHTHGIYDQTRLGPRADRTGADEYRARGHEGNDLGAWMAAAGYRTGLFGKYLNGYDGDHVPPGWDDWNAFSSEQAYYGYRLNENGRNVAHGTAEADYSTDVIAAKARAFIRAEAAAGRPFFAYVAPIAPHAPSTVAARHEGAYAGRDIPTLASYDEADVSDKPEWVKALPRLTPAIRDEIDANHRRRLATLRAVDELVAGIVADLDAAGALDDTYLVFTSDHGAHLGEHRIPLAKRTAYEESIRVPLVIRGPGVPTGTERRLAAMNDLAPTFLSWAGAPVPAGVDGRSLAPLLAGEPGGWRDAVLVETYQAVGYSPSLPFRMVRMADRSYVEYVGGRAEFYDLRADPHQLENLADDPGRAEEVAALAHRLAALRVCAGASCHAAEDGPVDVENPPPPILAGPDGPVVRPPDRDDGDRARLRRCLRRHEDDRPAARWARRCERRYG